MLIFRSKEIAMPRSVQLLIHLALLLLSPAAFAATVFDNGDINDYSGSDPTGAFVRDSAGGAPTTLNLLSGGDLGPVDVEDSSRLNVFAGSSVFSIDAFDSSWVTVSGGSHGGVDLRNDVTGKFSGGVFSSCGGPCLRVFDQAEGEVIDGSFSNPGQIVASASAFGVLWIRGGSFDGIVRASDDSAVEISGGTIQDVQSLNQAVLTIRGDGFLAQEGGSTLVNGFGEIADGFDGTITGTLADGSGLAIDALNGVVGSKIVLAPASAVSVPGLASLAARAALAAGLLIIGGLASWRIAGRESVPTPR
jgi:hypothetical protein